MSPGPFSSALENPSQYWRCATGGRAARDDINFFNHDSSHRRWESRPVLVPCSSWIRPSWSPGPQCFCCALFWRLPFQGSTPPSISILSNCSTAVNFGSLSFPCHWIYKFHYDFYNFVSFAFFVVQKQVLELIKVNFPHIAELLINLCLIHKCDLLCK